MSVCVDAKRVETRRTFAFVMLAVAIVGANIAFVTLHQSWFGYAVPEWPVAIDLLLVVPALYLVLKAPLGSAMIWRALAIAGVGVLAGSFIIPAESKQLWLVLEPLRTVVLVGLVLAQVCVVAWIISKIFAARHTENMELALDRAISDWIGSDGVSRVVRMESRVWLYALVSKPVRSAFPGERHFHVGAQGMNASNQLAFLILVGAEIPIAHFLIALFDPVVAAIVSAFSIYGFAFLLAEYRASIYRPISSSAAGLHLRHGVVADCFIPWQVVARVNRFNGSVRRAKGVMRLIGMGQANVMLELVPETLVIGLFGARQVQRIFVGVDEPDVFVADATARVKLSRTDKNEVS